MVYEFGCVIYEGKFDTLVRGALICTACDIPAACKICGFKGHNANHGCSRCFIFFPGPIIKKDYSGFDRENWPQRDIDKHRALSKKIKHTKHYRLETILK